MQLYSIYDRIKNQFSPPLMCITDGQAWREFDMFIANDAYATKHPEEFQLFCLGSYNQQDGIIVSTNPQPLIKNLDTEDLLQEEAIG